MGVSKLGPMDLMFIDARVKINGAYYREVLLIQKLMPVMRKICGEFFIFQQGNVPAYRACETINLLKRDTCVHFIRPFATQQHRSEPSSLQKCEDKCNSGYCKFMMSMNWSSAQSMSGITLSKASSMTQLISGANVSVHEFVWNEDFLSI